MSRGRKGFHPRQVPEIRNGYFWLVKDAQGIGSSSFRIPEGNKRSDFDLVQTTVASQPTVLTENGGLQFRMRRQADANPSHLITATAARAGWDGATYFSGWWRLPDASGDVTGQDYLFRHYGGGVGARRWNSSMLTAPIDNLVLQTSSDGTASALNRFDNSNIFLGANWVWVEHFVDPSLFLGGSAPGDLLKVASDMILRSATTTTGTLSGVLFNGNSALAMSGTGIAGFANADTTDWATAYYGNGIPTLKNRKRLANYLAPKTIKFQI